LGTQCDGSGPTWVPVAPTMTAAVEPTTKAVATAGAANGATAVAATPTPPTAALLAAPTTESTEATTVPAAIAVLAAALTTSPVAPATDSTAHIGPPQAEHRANPAVAYSAALVSAALVPPAVSTVSTAECSFSAATALASCPSLPPLTVAACSLGSRSR
jgi:hypothetical protein